MNFTKIFFLAFLIFGITAFSYSEKTDENISLEEFQKKLSEMVLPFTKNFNDNDILLKVNDSPIYYSDIKHHYLNMLKHHVQMKKEPLTDEIAKIFRKNLLKSHIEKKVLLQEIEKLNLLPAKEIVEKEFTDIKSQHDEEKFLKTLQFQGLTETSFKEMISYEMGIKALISIIDEKSKEVTDEQIEEAYNNNLDKFENPAKIQFSVIRIKNSDNSEETKNKNLVLINSIKEDIIAGKNSFEFYAKNFSDDMESRKNGGDCGIHIENELKEIFQPIKKLQENELSPIYSYDDGFYIAKVTKKEPKRLLPLLEVKDNIKNYLKMQDIMNLHKDYLDNLLKNSKIEIIKE